MKKVAVVLSSLLVVACASSLKTASLPSSQANNKDTPATAGANTASVSGAELNAELQKLVKQSDYFDYNKYVVKPEYQKVIQKQAEFIKGHKNDIVTLEGNADERGSKEYNLELGNKRAQAVQQNLEQLGVPDKQIQIVSLGKEKPRLLCHQEKCWKENRRVDFAHSI